jgi:hypothetical protein
MTWRKVSALVLCGTIGLAACGDEDGGGSDDEGGSGSATTAPATMTAMTAADGEVFLFRDDFRPVCNGSTVSDAAPYQAGEPGPHPVMAFAGAAPDYGEQFISLPDDWGTEIGEEELTELVVCMDRTSQTSAQVCEGYEDEGITWSVELFDASYDIVVRAATTGEEIASTSLVAAADQCPIFSSYREGDPNPKPDYAVPEDAMVEFLSEFVR